MNKYKNKKVIVDGVQFDSILESKYYKELIWLKQNRMIKGFELQPKFTLQDKFKLDGKSIRAIEYIADFKVINLDGSYEIIDCKGSKFVLTPVFKLKKKLFHYKFPDVKLRCLAHTKTKGWHQID